MAAIGQPSGNPAPSSPSTPPAVTPPSTGQAQQPVVEQGQPKPNGFWGRFPTVPEDQRAALEPHLKTVQGYVTRLEQTYVAPFRGYTPQQVQGLAQFAKAFDANPLQTFLNIAGQLQQRGTIHEDLDLEALAAVVQGQELPDPGNDGDLGDDWETAPPWAQELRAQQQAQQQLQEQQSRSQSEARENAILDHAINGIKTKLTEAGFPQDKISDKDITARFIVHNGSAEAVFQELTGLRTALLQGALPNDQDNTVDLPNGVPSSGRSSLQQRARKSSDPFAKASGAAEQFVRQSNKRDAQ